MITHVCFIAVTLAGSLGRCLNTRPAAPCSNNVFGTWQMLMHKKTCVIPIMDYLIFIISVCMRKSISMRDFPRPSKGLNIGPFLISPPPPNWIYCFWCGSRRRPLHFRALSSEPVDGFWPNMHRYIVGRRGRVD